jgi:hypothetical protein
MRMTKRNGSGPNNDDQIKRFIQTARELGCDESQESFDAKLKTIVSVKPITNVDVKAHTKRAKKDLGSDKS